MAGIVIVGAGQAGGWVARTLRVEGYAGRITLLGEELHPPHERPPLSKALLGGTVAPESTRLFKMEEFVKLDLDFRPGTKVVMIDRASRLVILNSGGKVPYAKLILCTGSRPNKLKVAGADSANVHYLRTIEDSMAIRSKLAERKRLLIIGAGWIGLEVAATARKLGATVTIIEALDRVCARAAPLDVSEVLRNLHESHGVSFRFGAAVTKIEDLHNHVAINLSDRTHVDGDLIVAGIGVSPNVELAREAGLAVENGIIVDDAARTSDGSILAAGDCTSMPLAYLNKHVRLESWANAQNQAIVAAKASLGQDVHYDEAPWFWSDQYDMNLQILGLPARYSDPVMRGNRSGTSFSFFYLEESRLVAVVSFNAPRDIRAARKLMKSGRPVHRDDLANAAVQLQGL